LALIFFGHFKNAFVYEQKKQVPSLISNTVTSQVSW